MPHNGMCYYVVWAEKNTKSGNIGSHVEFEMTHIIKERLSLSTLEAKL